MLTVTASLWYVTSCPDCVAEVERVTRAAARDAQVTRLTLSAGHKHNHPVEEKVQGLAQPPSAAALEAAGQQTLPGTLDAAKPYAEGA